MRITQGMMSANMLNNLTKSYSQIDKYLNQVNTGRKINKPSDDPFIAIKGLGYGTQLSQIEQYQRNTNEVHNWLDNSDAALDNGTQALQRIRALTGQAANDTYSEAERKNILEEVKQIKEDLIDTANRSVNGKYLFNGTDTDNAPITRNDDGSLNFNMSTTDVKIEVADDIKLTVNVNGNRMFGEELLGEDGTIEKLILALENNDREGISASLGAIDERIDDVLNTRAELGARMNRLTLIENRLEGQKIIAKDTKAKNELVEYEEAITNLITQETLHRAALSASTRVLQPTLMDFLR